MISLNEYRFRETYNQSMDGPPLEPHTIAGAEYQIRWLAHNIRTSFGQDEKFADFKKGIADASDLLEKAARALDSVSNAAQTSDRRNTPHKYFQ